MVTLVHNSTDSAESLRGVTMAARFLTAAHTFNQVYTPLLCLFGAVGNSLSVTVFCRTTTHRSLSASFYLSALAISDTGFLLNLLAVWLEDMGVPVITGITCPLVMYLGQVTCFLSVWFIVAFTMERFFAVCYPLTRPTVCTVARAKKVIAILTIVALLGFSYVWVIATVLEYPVQGPQVTTAAFFEGIENSSTENHLTTNELNSSSHLYYSHQPQVTTEYVRMGGDGELPVNIGLSQIPVPMNDSTEFVSYCSVRQEHLYFSSFASHVDSVLTLILPFAMIAYLNVRIAACVWRLQDQRANMVAVAKITRSNSSSGSSGTRTQVGFVYRSSLVTSPSQSNGRKNSSNLSQNHIHNHNHPSPNHLSPGHFTTTSTNSNNYRSKTNLSVDFEPSESSGTSSGVHCCSDFSARRHPRNNNRRKTGIRKRRLTGSSHVAAETRVTKTLLLVSTVFLVLNLPSHAFRAATFIESFWELELNIGQELFAAQQWANILFNMNFSVNFLLYCVSGRNFRAALKSIFCRVAKLPRYPKSKRSHPGSPNTYPSPRQSPMESHSLVRTRDSFYPVSTTEVEVETYA